jgi:hypothetical protein
VTRAQNRKRLLAALPKLDRWQLNEIRRMVEFLGQGHRGTFHGDPAWEIAFSSLVRLALLECRSCRKTLTRDERRDLRRRVDGPKLMTGGRR